MGSKRGKNSSASASASASLEVALDPIPEAVFPDSLPNRKEKFFISIVVGQTHLHWSMHEGFAAECKASVFWKTELTTLAELRRNFHGPSDALGNHVPEQYRSYFFGGLSSNPESSTPKNAWMCSWKRQIPNVNVYVLTLGTSFDEALQYIFKEQPSRLYHLSPVHFWPTSCCDDVRPHMVHNGIELQRRASLKAAVHMFGHPALVMDGGTFHGLWHYTATNADGTSMGGGFSANMAFSWLAMHHSTGKLPLLQYTDLMVQYPQLAAQPASSRAVTSTTTTNGTGGDDNNSPAAPPISIFARTTPEAIMSSALMSLAVKCRSILNHWLHQVGAAEEPPPRVHNEASTADNQPLTTTTAATTTSTAATSQDSNKESSSMELQEGDAPAASHPQPSPTLTTQPDQTTMNTEEAAATSSSPTEPELQVNANAATAASSSTSAADDMQVDEPQQHSVTAASVKKNYERMIVITGAEKEFMYRLMQPNHGGIIEPDPTATLPEVNKDFCIHSERHLVSTAISLVLYEQQLEHEKAELTSTIEQVRQDLIGLRVAVEFEKPQFPDGDLWYRGFVVKVDRQVDEVDWKSTLEGDLYWIRFDDGDNQELNPFELYCALLKYSELGERDVELGEVDEETAARRSEKVRDAKLYAEQLRKHSRVVQKKVEKLEGEKRKEVEKKQRREEKARRAQEKQQEEEERAKRIGETTPLEETPADPPVEEEAKEEEKEEAMEVEEEEATTEQPPVASQESAVSVEASAASTAKSPTPTASTASRRGRKPGSSNKKGSKAATPSSSRKRVKVEDEVPSAKKIAKDPDAFVGKRLAKKFDDGNVYFGKVTKFSPRNVKDPEDQDYWWIIYDDGDTEQFDRNDMVKGFKLYLTRKHLDENADKDGKDDEGGDE